MAKEYTLGALLRLMDRMETAAFTFYGRLRHSLKDRPELREALTDIMADEANHARVVREIRDALPEARRGLPVPPRIIHDLTRALELITDRADEIFCSTDGICMAIEEMEALEFDVVLSFASEAGIPFDFAKAYLENQTVDHTNKVYRFLRAFA